MSDFATWQHKLTFLFWLEIQFIIQSVCLINKGVTEIRGKGGACRLAKASSMAKILVGLLHSHFYFPSRRSFWSRLYPFPTDGLRLSLIVILGPSQEVIVSPCHHLHRNSSSDNRPSSFWWNHSWEWKNSTLFLLYLLPLLFLFFYILMHTYRHTHTHARHCSRKRKEALVVHRSHIQCNSSSSSSSTHHKIMRESMEAEEEEIISSTTHECMNTRTYTHMQHSRRSSKKERKNSCR